ncbi:MAG: DUF58 domain-containing protein [Bacteroidales bacterium]|jgi:uncharacterized protein (DUF58 family)|nr:DUF58 domain-containing protein [Bacteroidales bacterium]
MKLKVKSLYLTRRFFVSAGVWVLLFIAAYILPALLLAVQFGFFTWLVVVLVDLLILYSRRNGIYAVRSVAERLSNGSDNEVFLHIENRYPLAVDVEAIDEIPFQFQKRDVSFRERLEPAQTKVIRYLLRPVKRGEYTFGRIHVFVTDALGFISRRYTFGKEQVTPVYPSYIEMRKYELMAISNRLTEYGIKRIRKIGHSSEFEHIRPYMEGDDPRTVNARATARRTELMVNNYRDEKSQQVYCLIDKGRTMQMPFEGLSLLDYAINTSLVISNIALIREDKAGLITFSNRISNILPAERRRTHIHKILDTLYNQRTLYRESDFEMLYAAICRRITQRSLLVLYTNFETIQAMRRQLPFLKRLAAKHLVLAVIFENTELKKLTDRRPSDLEEIYTKAVAEQFACNKKIMSRELNRHGIYTVLTRPADLTVNTINQYLEFKARGMI